MSTPVDLSPDPTPVKRLPRFGPPPPPAQSQRLKGKVDPSPHPISQDQRRDQEAMAHRHLRARLRGDPIPADELPSNLSQDPSTAVRGRFITPDQLSGQEAMIRRHAEARLRGDPIPTDLFPGWEDKGPWQPQIVFLGPGANKYNQPHPPEQSTAVPGPIMRYYSTVMGDNVSTHEWLYRWKIKTAAFERYMHDFMQGEDVDDIEAFGDDLAGNPSFFEEALSRDPDTYVDDDYLV